MEDFQTTRDSEKRAERRGWGLNLAAALNPTEIMNTHPEIVMLQPQTMW